MVVVVVLGSSDESVLVLLVVVRNDPAALGGSLVLGWGVGARARTRFGGGASVCRRRGRIGREVEFGGRGESWTGFGFVSELGEGVLKSETERESQLERSRETGGRRRAAKIDDRKEEDEKRAESQTHQHPRLPAHLLHPENSILELRFREELMSPKGIVSE